MSRRDSYSRGTYDAAAKAERDAIEALQQAEHVSDTPSTAPESTPQPQADAMTILAARAKEAHKRVQQLHDAGHVEAKGLNEEYDRLWRKAQDAIDALNRFEQRSLGMTTGLIHQLR